MSNSFWCWSSLNFSLVVTGCLNFCVNQCWWDCCVCLQVPCFPWKETWSWKVLASQRFLSLLFFGVLVRWFATSCSLVDALKNHLWINLGVFWLYCVVWNPLHRYDKYDVIAGYLWNYCIHRYLNWYLCRREGFNLFLVELKDGINFYVISYRSFEHFQVKFGEDFFPHFKERVHRITGDYRSLLKISWTAVKSVLLCFRTRNSTPVSSQVFINHSDLRE